MPRYQYSPSVVEHQAPAGNPEVFNYYFPPDALFGPVHFTEYPPNPDHKLWTLEDLQWYTCPEAPEDPYQILRDRKETTIYPLIFNRKYNNPSAYLIPMKPSLPPKPIISTPTSDVTGQNSQFLGGLYLALTGLINSALPEAGPWAMTGKALSHLVKLGHIIWWTMPVPASAPPSPKVTSQYSWYPDIKSCRHGNQAYLFISSTSRRLDQSQKRELNVA
ncbi:hypothetical protein DSO57_1038739 [Entomophthora muscae]|uniref:Uncharacterized protein n=2 Tax=Entomophthora muscae TaxID=34485 RepID=A0ACC2TKZ9_9FUNG|nr:hypothetical protein DSO57_1013190 [Entomophthora muscae]KAJ9075165.1 hypothetical protein DSO57_1038739 [Entomophthora muscae]